MLGENNCIWQIIWQTIIFIIHVNLTANFSLITDVLRLAMKCGLTEPYYSKSYGVDVAEHVEHI